MGAAKAMENPKRRGDESLPATWYRYYAGFSEAFAKSILSTSELDKGSWILDPWNGSGTTTATATALGYNSIGLDLNPAMVVVAKARGLDPAEYPSLKPLSTEILGKATRSFQTDSNDPLLTWFLPNSVASIRGIEASVQKLLIDEEAYAPIKTRSAEKLSDLAAYFYVALFRTVRSLLRPFYASNPTWLKNPKSVHARLRPSKEVVLVTFKSELSRMLPKEADSKASRSAEKVLKVASSEKLPIERNTVDLVLASPPYCTRIDYAVATWAELAILGFRSGVEFAQLRRELIGSTTVPKQLPATCDSWGSTCLDFLDRLKSHNSKASATYYYKNHLQYFASLCASIGEVERVLKPAGRCVLVVQDSYYKDLHTDLAAVMSEMATKRGLSLHHRQDFRLKRTMAGVNPGSSEYRNSFEATESVLSFNKPGELQTH